jgi:hypothetical protein
VRGYPRLRNWGEYNDTIEEEEVYVETAFNEDG